MNSRSPPNQPADVPSPCVSVCTMDATTGLCVGCDRTIAEIAHWSQMTDSEKTTVWARIAKRRQRT
ncbi:MAG: DUF1289 domain-containing protein [Burkholderiaceae bacterium]